MKQFLSSKDITDTNIFLNKIATTAQNPYKNAELGKNKTLVLLFFNPSLRTRLSTTKAAQNLGMNVLSLNISQAWGIEFEDGSIMNIDKAEHIKEAAAVISQYADIIGVRSFPGLKDKEEDYKDHILNQFVKYASVPIINLESATLHPLQSLTDLYTIETYKNKKQPKVVLSWAPHPKALPQSVPNSFIEWMNRTSYDFVISHPIGYELSPHFVKNNRVEYDQEKAFLNADFIYAKNWSSYSDYGKILSTKTDWTITSQKMTMTNNAYFMHCLPVRRNVVVNDEVIDGPNSLIIQQAKNREIIAETVLSEILKTNSHQQQ